MDTDSSNVHTRSDPPKRDGADAAALRAASVVLDLREKLAARFVLAVFDAETLRSIGPELGINPLPGKRWKTMTDADHALLLARTLRTPSKQQSTLLERVASALPLSPSPADASVTDESIATWSAYDRMVPLETRLAALLAVALDKNRKDVLTKWLEDDFLARPLPVTPASEPEAPLGPEQEALRRLEQKIVRIEKEHADARAAGEEREKALRLRIDQLQTELSDLQQRVGKKHREHEELKQLYETAKGDLEIAFRRAARFKQTLDESKAPSDREKELLEAYGREKLRAEIEAAKVEILEYELDILQQDDEERDETPSGEPARHSVLDRIAVFVQRFGSRPKILIVGGAGKQRSHRERDFEELKSRIGVDGEWRFADYNSWHRDLQRLRNDIQHRFDLVFVLHWNRTTFVQKMHDEARALNGRVRTVPYRGFLSLERAVTEEVERFVNERIA